MPDLSLTEHLARWLVRWRENGFPRDVRATAQNYVLDWLGSALAGAATDVGKRLCDYARTQPAGNASIIGLNRACSAETAALVNGALSHIVEMDDLDRASVLHPGAAVIPAAFAVAEATRAPGRDFLAAVVAGYEVAIRVGEAVGKRHYYYFHNTATCGVFGAAAAAGWLLNLNAKQFVWALGNAGTQAAGLWEFNADGAMSKHLHAGRAAANGALAAQLAQFDFTGARAILEGPRGFFAATAPDAQPARVLENLDAPAPRFKISGVSIKPHASCRHTHSAIDAALALRAQLNPRAIQRVQIDTYPAALDLCNNSNPQTEYAAKFSLHFCVASALLRGHAGLEDFANAALTDSAVRELLPRITATVEPEFQARYPAEWATRIRITASDGEMLSATVINPKGDPENPLSQNELAEKFRQLAAFAGHGAHADAYIAWVSGLDADEPLFFPR